MKLVSSAQDGLILLLPTTKEEVSRPLKLLGTSKSFDAHNSFKQMENGRQSEEVQFHH